MPSELLKSDWMCLPVSALFRAVTLEGYLLAFLSDLNPCRLIRRMVEKIFATVRRE